MNRNDPNLLKYLGSLTYCYSQDEISITFLIQYFTNHVVVVIEYAMLNVNKYMIDMRYEIYEFTVYCILDTSLKSLHMNSKFMIMNSYRQKLNYRCLIRTLYLIIPVTRFINYKIFYVHDVIFYENAKLEHVIREM